MTLSQSLLGALGWLALVFGAAFLGTRIVPDSWYKGLEKPSWNPPRWIFAPVWSVLYLLMAGAAWWVWRQHGVSGAGQALGFFLTQLLLNVLWTWLFFWLRKPAWAFAESMVLWCAILATLVLFWRLEPVAGALLIPYLVWVTFATGLNGKIWAMNR